MLKIHKVNIAERLKCYKQAIIMATNFAQEEKGKIAIKWFVNQIVTILKFKNNSV